MASSTFSDVPRPANDRAAANNTLIIIVNNDGTLSVDQETLHGLLAEQETSTTAVRLIRLGVAPDDGGPDSSDSEESNSSHVNITVEGYYPPSASQAGSDDIVDPFLGMDPEEMERLESALQSDEAKQILGEDVAAMLDILSVEDGTMTSNNVNDSIKMDHCYTNRMQAPPIPVASSTSSQVGNIEPFVVKGPGRPRKDNVVRNPRVGMTAANSNLVMVKHIKTLNPPLQQNPNMAPVKKVPGMPASSKEGASGSVLKRNAPVAKAASAHINITEEMLNEKLQEIQHSTNEYTNMSGDDLEEKSNSSGEQNIDVDLLQGNEVLNVSSGIKNTGGKGTAPRKVAVRNPGSSATGRQTSSKPLQQKSQSEAPRKLITKQSSLESPGPAPKAGNTPTSSAVTPSQSNKTKYPKRENRKPPAHLIEDYNGPPLFSVLDVPRRVSMDFHRETDKPPDVWDPAAIGHGARHPSTDSESGRRRSDEKPGSLRGRSPRQSLDNSDTTDVDSELMGGATEDDPHKLWCICKKPHNNRFMICCDSCEEWFHGKCVGVTKALGKSMEEEGNEWTCPNCKKKGIDDTNKSSKKQMKMTTFLSSVKRNPTETNVTEQSDKPVIDEKADPPIARSVSVTVCIVCKKSARTNSIYCSDACILKHAQDSKPVSSTPSQQKSVVKPAVPTRKPATIAPAPSTSQAGTLKAWLTANPTMKVIKTTVASATSQTVVVVKAPSVQPTKPKQAQLIAPKPLTPTPVRAPAKLTGSLDAGQKAVAGKAGSSGISSHSVQSSEKMQAGTKQSPGSLLREKPVASKVEGKRPSLPETPKKEDKKQGAEPIRLNVRNTLHELLFARIQECDDLKSIPEEKVKKMGQHIEEELYALFRDTGAKYKSKYRSLVFNIKDAKNLTLFRKIAEKSITPHQLVRLTPEEMASQELAQWRERESQHQLEMIKKNELDLLAQSKQYVMKTHKGEQVIESEDGVKNDVPQLESIDSLVVGSSQNSVTSTVSDTDGQDKPKALEKDRSRRSGSKSSKSRKSKKDKKDRHHKDGKSHSRSGHKDKHHSKSHREHKKSTSSVDGKDSERSSDHERSKASKVAATVMDERSIKEVILGKIVEDTNADLEPTSTVNIKTPDIDYSEDPVAESDSTIVWKGVAEMPEVAKFLTTIHIVSGESEYHCQSLSNKLDVVGRITPKLVWDHVAKMKKNDSYEIMVVRLEASSVAERIPYATLYSYLNSRSRLGVVGVKGIVGPVSSMIKDFYIYPLSKHSPLPQELLPLNGPGLEDDRRDLLLGILVARSTKKRVIPALTNVVAPAAKIPRGSDASDVSGASARSYTPPLPDETLSKPSADAEKRPHLEELAAIKLRVSNLLNEEGDEPYSPGDTGSATDDLLAAPTDAEDLQRKMEELNRKIEEQKQEIENMSSSLAVDSGISNNLGDISRFSHDQPPSDENEAYSPSESITPPLQGNIPFLSSLEKAGSSSFMSSGSQDIALPSNLHEILANIKKQSDVKLDIKSDPIVQTYASSQDEDSFDLPGASDEYDPGEPQSSQDISTVTKPAAVEQAKPPPLPKPAQSTLSKLSDEELIQKAAAMEREMILESMPVETFNKPPPSIKVPPVKYSCTSTTALTDGLLNLPKHPSKVSQPRPPGVEEEFAPYLCPPPPPPAYPPPRYNMPPPPLPPPEYPPPPFPPTNVGYGSYVAPEAGYATERSKRKYPGSDQAMQGSYAQSGKKGKHWGAQ